MIKKLLNYIGEYKKDTILAPIFVILEVIMDISIPTSIRIESVDGIIDTISSSMDSLNGILDNCLETIDSINIPQISSVDFKNLINRNVI